MFLQLRRTDAVSVAGSNKTLVAFADAVKSFFGFYRVGALWAGVFAIVTVSLPDTTRRNDFFFLSVGVDKANKQFW